jgi:hypothetical protein
MLSEACAHVVHLVCFGISRRFDGFDKTDKPKVAEYVSKTFSTQLKDIKMDVQGKNAGALELVSPAMACIYDRIAIPAITHANRAACLLSCMNTCAFVQAGERERERERD